MAEPVARLIVERDGRPNQTHELTVGTHTLGRVRNVDIMIGHVDVSRRHAELEVTPDSATIRDLASKNGVTVNGRKVDTAVLDDGARIGLGQLRLVLDHPGARISSVLRRGGEPTVRRPSSRVATVEPSERRSVVAPVVASLVFVVLLALLLVFGCA